MNKKPTVWVTQQGMNDYSPAEEFGEVEFITDRDWVKMEGAKVNNWICQDVKKFATMYVAGVDYIITAGNPIVSALVISFIVSQNPLVLHNYLKWDGRRGIYIPHQIGPLTVHNLSIAE